MIDIYNLYQSFASMNNTHQGGFFRPERDFVPAVHTVSLDIFNRLAGKLEKTKQITDMLLPFYRSMNVVVVTTPAMDYAPRPDDYSYFSSAKVLVAKGSLDQSECEACLDKNCKVLSEGQCLPPEDLADFFPVETEFEEIDINDVADSKFGAATRHKTKGPTMQSPIGTQVPDGYKVMPRNIGVVMLHYYANPVVPVLDYDDRTVGPDLFIDYKQASSTQLAWDDKMTPVFLYKLCLHYGLFVEDQLKMQVASIANDLV